MARRRRPDETSLEEARELLRLVNESSIVELQAVWDGGRLSMRKDEPHVDEHSRALGDRADGSAGLSAPPEPRVVVVSAPTVGRFWRGTGASMAFLVEKGQHVQAGQQLATVESLAAPVDVLAEQGGEVEEILAEDGQAVGYADPLFALRVDDA